MRNASASVWRPESAHTLQWRNPNGDFAATYVNTPGGRTTGRLTIDQIPLLTEGRLADMHHDTFVIVYGTVETVHVFPDRRRPYLDWNRAAVRVSSGTGADVIIDVPALTYDRIWGYLVMGRSFGFSGTVRRPSPDAPTVIQLARLLLAGADIDTVETYTQRTAQAVTV